MIEYNIAGYKVILTPQEFKRYITTKPEYKDCSYPIRDM